MFWWITLPPSIPLVQQKPLFSNGTVFLLNVCVCSGSLWEEKMNQYLVLRQHLAAVNAAAPFFLSQVTSQIQNAKPKYLSSALLFVFVWSFYLFVFVSKALFPSLSKSKQSGGGTIINLIDIYSQLPLKNFPLYCMTKAALVGFQFFISSYERLNQSDMMLCTGNANKVLSPRVCTKGLSKPYDGHFQCCRNQFCRLTCSQMQGSVHLWIECKSFFFRLEN